MWLVINMAILELLLKLLNFPMQVCINPQLQLFSVEFTAQI